MSEISNHHGGDTVTVTVFAPKEVDGKTFTFRVNLMVGAAASEAALAFGYPPGTKASFKKDGTVLDAAKTLEAAHVRTGDKLSVVDIGGGVWRSWSRAT
jgi:hypothetical protein